jgi:hypothetical protein
MSEREGRLSRWSRRKREAEAAEREAAQPKVPAAAEGEAETVDLAGLTDAEALERLGLKDPDEMQPGDDFSAFLKQAVPEHLRRRALRRLWRSNPVLANLDGLNDYDTDFTGDSVAPGTLKTAYKVGVGLVRDLPQAAEAAAEATAEAAGEAKPAADEAAARSDADTAEVRDIAEENHKERQISQDDDRSPARPRRRMRFDFEA